MTYTQITPTQDWFFRHDGVKPTDPPILYQVAAWALKSPDAQGQTAVVGLIAPIFPGEGGRKLHEPPPVEGYYIHREQLTELELQSLKKR
ncbi:hypothetical protein ALP02_200174 [Pseudomonas coronafaciens pv. garcae]|nr:hypothetical protein ALP02_200174 [Pseudomonas coronafaciens pv. garcae]